MKFKKSMLILILAVFLISIAGVCASDVNDTELTSQDSTTVELTQIDENDKISSADESQVIGQTDNQEIISADGNGTFAELESEIRSGYNSHITLGRDYEYEGSGYSNGISITESITIDGKGHTIDAKGKVNIFDIRAENVIIKNITFINSKGTSDNAAIHWSYAQGSVSDCIFINNVATLGGAIFGEHSDCNISGCVFTRNSASFGGAIHWASGQCDISDCIFKENAVSAESAPASAGGALFLVRGCTVYDCIFVSNSASRSGAAIYWNNNNCVVTNCYFVKNSGGTIVSSYNSENMAVNYNVFLDNDGDEISFSLEDSSMNNDYNWYGHTADNYRNKPILKKCNNWLFLNATANPNAIPVFGSSDIVFKLYAYNSSEVSEFDNSLLKAINLTLTPTNGNVNITEVGLDEPVRFNPEDYGICKLTAKIENVEYTTTLEIADGTTFSDLNFVINGNDNDTIVLDRDYTYNPIFDSDLTEGIVINRPLTIVGNGHTLNATGLARIFSIQASNVVIENITFVNGKTDRHGGAIFWSGNNANISDCIFVNNSADGQGAAINLDGDDSVVSNCIFVNNNAYSGGAVYWSGDNGNFSGCSFVNNSARLDGGAITFISYKGSVSDCSFVNNSARLDGGAIYLDESDESIVSNCSFVNNSAESSGGAISLRYTKDGIVSDCSFVNNSASDDGGAVYWSGDNGNVSGSIFVNNSANYGIIYFDNSFYGHLSVNDNIFLNNDGVAIYFVDSDSTSNADYNWFGNNATNYDVAPTTTNVELGAWLFLNATANPDKISISDVSDIVFRLYAYDSNGVSEYDSSRLKAVNLTVTPTNGRVNTTKTELGESVQFTAESGGIGEITASIENASYTISVPISDGTSFVDLNRTINGNDNDTIVLDNDYIYNPVFDYDLTGGIVIDRPVTIIGNGHTLNATGLARIFNIQADNVTIENITFANGNRVDNGGAIFWRGANGNVSGCTFVNNYAKFSGGAIYWIHGYDSIVSNCSFADNSVQFDGAAMYYVASAGSVVSDCSFEKNSAVERGGAIYIYESNGCTVSDCSFVKNSASKYSGGAIYWDGHNANVSGCSFADNSAKDDGGAIFLTYSEGSVVSDCSFVHNSASNHGGAIFWGRYANDGVVSDCSFVNNHANSNGGAIYWNSDKGVVSDCSFVHNTATRNAGALFWYANEGRVSGCTFVNNSAGDKSVIKFYNGENHNLTVNDNIFLNNEGVAISFVRSDSTSNADYNWFGNNATNYDIAPTTTNVELGTWLFLNATAYPASISVSESSDILFKLYSYDSSGVSDYDDSKLPVVNLTVTANNGNVNERTVALGDSVEYTYNGGGDASVTASIENAEYTIVLDIAKADSILSADDLAMTYKDGSKWNVTLTDTNGNPISGRVVKFGIKDKIYSIVTDENGVAGLAINLIPDTYDINATFEGDGDYEASFVNATVTINKGVATLSAVDLEMAYKDGSAWIVTLTDMNGDAIVGVRVAIGICNKTYNIKTDDAGSANLTINLMPGTYDINASFTSSRYEAQTITATVTINKLVPTLSAEDLVMNYKDGSAWNVTLKDASGNIMANTYVKFTIGNKTYNRKTNENGVASLPIGLAVGNYTITTEFTGTATLAAVEISNTIVVNLPEYNLVASDINMTYQDGTNYTVQITDGEGNPVAQAGVIIKVTVNGNSYNRKTNADGIAALPIGLKAGTYPITAEYNGKQITNTIVVNKA